MDELKEQAIRSDKQLIAASQKALAATTLKREDRVFHTQRIKDCNRRIANLSS